MCHQLFRVCRLRHRPLVRSTTNQHFRSSRRCRFGYTRVLVRWKARQGRHDVHDTTAGASAGAPRSTRGSRSPLAPLGPDGHVSQPRESAGREQPVSTAGDIAASPPAPRLAQSTSTVDVHQHNNKGSDEQIAHPIPGVWFWILPRVGSGDHGPMLAGFRARKSRGPRVV